MKQTLNELNLLKNTISREDQFALNVFPKRQLVIISGKEALLYDEEGKEYIDCIGGWGVATIGHANPVITTAIQKQADQLITCPGILYNDIRADFMEKLVSITPEGLDQVFLTNSGTESIEAAIKFALYTTRKSKFIAAIKSFHGRSIGSLHLTHNKKYRTDFSSMLHEENTIFVPFNSIEHLKAAITDDIAAVILEPIQGEGGVNPGDIEYFQNVRKLCDDNNILLIIDEVQTGFCRTGDMFAIDYLGIVPDILCLAKAIAGGLPMGAVLTSDKIKFSPGKHGTTFGGNPLACAAGLAAVKFMEDNDLANQAKEKGEYLMQHLHKELDNNKLVRRVKGRGLMIGIELKVPVKPYVDELMNLGVLVIPTGKSIIRLLPPAVISYAQIDSVILTITQVLNVTEK